MTGYLVPELWCNGCHERVLADTETTLTQLRANVGDSGWCTHRAATVDAAAALLLSGDDRASGYADFCSPRCCPVCEEDR